MEDTFNAALLRAIITASEGSDTRPRDYPTPTVFTPLEFGYIFHWPTILGHCAILVDVELHTTVILSNLFGQDFLLERMGVDITTIPPEPVPPHCPTWPDSSSNTALNIGGGDPRSAD